MTNNVLQLIKRVDQDYDGLGQPVVFSLMGMISKRSVFIIASKGTGKTTAVDIAAQLCGMDVLKLDEITRAGLIDYQELLDDSKAVIYIKDLGGINDRYNRDESVNTSVNLTYSHEFVKVNKYGTVNISNFHGSFITTVQPFAFSRFVRQLSYENALSDRIIRYYHLNRPKKPNNDPPDYGPLELRIGIDEVSDRVNLREFNKVLRYFDMQFTTTRAEQHCLAMLKAIAVINNRRKITMDDYVTLSKVASPLLIESHVFTRAEPETPLSINHMILVILTEFLSYGEIDFSVMRINYKISKTNIRKSLRKYEHLFEPHARKKDVIVPSDVMSEIMEEIRGR